MKVVQSDEYRFLILPISFLKRRKGRSLPPRANHAFSLALEDFFERGDIAEYVVSTCVSRSFSNIVVDGSVASMSREESVISREGGSSPFSLSSKLEQLPDTGTMVEDELGPSESVLSGGPDLILAIMRCCFFLALASRVQHRPDILYRRSVDSTASAGFRGKVMKSQIPWKMTRRLNFAKSCQRSTESGVRDKRNYIYEHSL